ncbi:hypothetical protein [uncultured Campylobacter sp.]|uniref:hypothetical protein n=1 Tax=uncultured Campylobacter sp. TaxID=218934 RepID=UPI002620097F|nr:hypothetical protein [uncultured Campylobacter sp.]
MTPREIFLNGCAEIAANFTDFKPTQKGQKLTKIASDKEILFEIYFSSSMRNYAGSVSILPQIAIYCKRLKKLMQEELSYSTDLVFVSHLSYLTPRRQFRDWQLAGANFEPSVCEISAAIKDYALPIFELFEDKRKAVEFMTQRGAKFNKNLSAFDLCPIYFVYYFGGKDAAEAFFNICLSDCTYKGRFYKLYEELANGAEADFSRSSFVGDTEAKFAFIKGLRILNG